MNATTLVGGRILVRSALTVIGALGAAAGLGGCASPGVEGFDALRVGYSALSERDDAHFRPGFAGLHYLLVRDPWQRDHATDYVVVTSESGTVVAKAVSEAVGREMTTEFWATRDGFVEYYRFVKLLAEPTTRPDVWSDIRDATWPSGADPHVWLLVLVRLGAWLVDQPPSTLMVRLNGESVSWDELWSRIGSDAADSEIWIRDRSPREMPRFEPPPRTSAPVKGTGRT